MIHTHTHTHTHTQITVRMSPQCDIYFIKPICVILLYGYICTFLKPRASHVPLYNKHRYLHYIIIIPFYLFIFVLFFSRLFSSVEYLLFALRVSRVGGMSPSPPPVMYLYINT